LLGNILNVTVFVLKGWVGVFIMMWVRWTLPRLRIDQVMMTCLKYLTPISCFLLLAVTIWQLTLDRVSMVAVAWRYGSAIVLALAVIAWIIQLWRTPSEAPPGVTGWARRPPKMPGELVGVR
jgi:NADH-quinone oxidoreductase subunit H